MNDLKRERRHRRLSVEDLKDWMVRHGFKDRADLQHWKNFDSGGSNWVEAALVDEIFFLMHERNDLLRITTFDQTLATKMASDIMGEAQWKEEDGSVCESTIGDMIIRGIQNYLSVIVRPERRNIGIAEGQGSSPGMGEGRMGEGDS